MMTKRIKLTRYTLNQPWAGTAQRESKDAGTRHRRQYRLSQQITNLPVYSKVHGWHESSQTENSKNHFIWTILEPSEIIWHIPSDVLLQPLYRTYGVDTRPVSTSWHSCCNRLIHVLRYPLLKFHYQTLTTKSTAAEDARSVCDSWRLWLSSQLRAERQSARMSKITNDGLTRSGTGCFIAVSIWQQWALKGRVKGG